MKLAASDLKLFGIDLGAWWRVCADVLRDLHAHPALAWMAPPKPVRVVGADGSEWIWDGRRRHGSPAALAEFGARNTRRFQAVELPEAIVLRRTLRLPAMPAADTAEAVALDVRAASPFEAADLVWGWQSSPAGARQVVQVALASRRQAQQVLDAAAARLATSDAVEVWAAPEPADAAPVVVSGYGEAVRQRDQQVRLRLMQGSLLLVALLLAALAATPTIQLHMQAAEADAALVALQRSSADAVRQREALLQANEGMQSLADLLGTSADPLRALAVLTTALPDDTYVQTLQVAGNKVGFTGLTADAAAVMTRLGAADGMRDVRASQAATRQPGALKESFGVEFVLQRPPVTAASLMAERGSTPMTMPMASAPLPAPLSPGAVPSLPAVDPTAAAPSPQPAPPTAPPPAPPVAAPVPPAPPAGAAPAPSGFSIGGSSRSQPPAAAPGR